MSKYWIAQDDCNCYAKRLNTHSHAQKAVSERQTCLMRLLYIKLRNNFFKLQFGYQNFFNFVPVNHIEPIVDVIYPFVFIFQIIRVFPYID